MRESKPLALWQAVITALAVLSGSVAVPILCRPVYYAHIGALHLEEWGLTREEICRAYDQMLDFCLGLRPDFAAGVLRFSADGACGCWAFLWPLWPPPSCYAAGKGCAPTASAAAARAFGPLWAWGPPF